MSDIVTALQSLRDTYPATPAGTTECRAAVRALYARIRPA